MHNRSLASQGLIEPAMAVFRPAMPELSQRWKQQIIDCLLMPSVDSAMLEIKCSEILAAYLESLYTGSTAALHGMLSDLIDDRLPVRLKHIMTSLLLLNNMLLARLLADDRATEAVVDSFEVASSRIIADIATFLHFSDENQALCSLEWLSEGPDAATETTPQAYGDVTALNSERLILDSVGADILQQTVHDYLDLLGTSAAIYERGGDYATGIFSSSWCRFMDQSSRNLCGGDNKEALSSGQWHCHESCWDTSKKSMETGRATDLECKGGIRIFAVPIQAGDKIIGAINFGYGDPPKDEARLQELAERYKVPIEDLRAKAAQYQSRPPFIIELAKRRLHSAARLIGEIVARREAYAQLEEVSRALRQSNDDLQQFVCVASHDLQEPLGTINSYLDLFRMRLPDQLDEKATKYMNHVQDAAKRMQCLISDLLAYSRIDQRPAAPSNTNAEEVLLSTIAGLKGSIDKCGASITHDALPTVHIDSSGLAQIFQNLLSNAIKFRGDAIPSIHVSASRSNGEWLFSVRDNGIGIEPQYGEQIFQLFRRLHTRDVYSGTGVGLAICKKIVERNHGRIWVESEPGAGSTFFFTVPATKRGLE